MFQFKYPIRVRYADTDKMGVVYHSNYLKYFEIARTESIRDLGMTYAAMEKAGILLPVVELQCKYIRPATYDDLLMVTANLHELPQGHRLQFHQEVYNENNKLLAKGQVLLYFLDAVTMQRCAIPDDLQEKLRPFFLNHNK